MNLSLSNEFLVALIITGCGGGGRSNPSFTDTLSNLVLLKLQLTTSHKLVNCGVSSADRYTTRTDLDSSI